MLTRLWLLTVVPCGMFAQTVSTVAGNSSWGSASDVAVDKNGNLFVVDYNKHAIYKVTPQAASTLFAGTVGQGGYAGDGGAATSAKLSNPTSVAIDSGGTVYIADTYNHRIRQVNSGGIITTFAGTGTNGFSGDRSRSQLTLREALDVLSRCTQRTHSPFLFAATANLP